MKAGFAEAVITPTGRCWLAGYGGPWSTGVHDDLYVSAVYIEQEIKALLLSFDLIGMEADLIADLKTSIQQDLSLDRDHIFFTCTHTHEGPEVRKRTVKQYQESETDFSYMDDYVCLLKQRVREAAMEATAQAQECDILVNRAYVDENINRRFFMNDERLYYIPGYKDLIPLSNQHMDKELGLIYFCPTGSRQPFGTILNYTMHPLTAGNTSTLISADVPGVVRNLIRESMQCHTCYITGAAGDNHPKGMEAGFAETRRVGQVLATQAVLRRYDARKVEGPFKLGGMTRSVRLKQRTLDELREMPLTPDQEARLERLLDRVINPGGDIDVEFTLLAIGPVLYVGVPGELLSELGSMIKWSSPFKRTYIMYQATESFGYIAHPNAYVWGGYEPTSGQLSPHSVRPLMDAIVDAMGELTAQCR